MQLRFMIKKILPKSFFNFRHWWYAWYGAVKYGHPSKKMFVIGVTGTSGKSTTIFLLRQMFESVGLKIGSLSTIDFYVNGKTMLNDQKMTMLGKMKTQQYLCEMVDNGCEVAIVETTSEGQVQYRDRYIAYDVMILTNLYPEHIESHGSYENYKEAKLNIFRRAAQYGRGKVVSLSPEHQTMLANLYTKGTKEIKKTFIVNGDIPEAAEFLDVRSLASVRRIVFGQTDTIKNTQKNVDQSSIAEDIYSDKEGLHFKVGDYRFDPEMYGEHNVMNILITIAVARQFDIAWNLIQKVVHTFKNAPGRNEFIVEAEGKGFQVIVDYAFEPKAMAALYKVVELLQPKRVIHVFGSTGGGRDVARRFSLGTLIGEKADICIVTDEDSYDDDPQKIIDDVASAVRKTGKRDGTDLFLILDRHEAIRRGLQIADVGDLVLITGKGSEQAMCISGGRKIPWDDRAIVREELKKI